MNAINSYKGTEAIKSKIIELLRRIPNRGNPVWEYRNIEPNQRTKKREILELLCGAIWHLDLAARCGDFSKKSFRDLRSENVTLPVEIWLEQIQRDTANHAGTFLTSCFSMEHNNSNQAKYFIQSMLLADTALRLAGIRDILSRLNIDKNRASPVTATRSEICKWLEQNTFLSDPIKEHIIIIEAFRDSFMHGEFPTDTKNPGSKNLRNFRIENLYNYSPLQIAQNCLNVCEKILDKITEIFKEETL